MRYLLISILLAMSSISCSSIGKGNIQGNAKDLNWQLDGKQEMKAEFYDSGQIKSIEVDNKSEPLISIGDLKPKFGDD